ncbi:unnamed protein product [Peronospora belbahrii]|uniref:Uncharacterized protein n=1 Tax=Peronospora belbahrii TaxID=622444 RepID=A0AAU9LCT1_9STRA|nr:unnamed protein product [Peronospora belbahrii]CAH0518167.1 unnamed protein product [Peronospora belbahrii]
MKVFSTFVLSTALAVTIHAQLFEFNANDMVTVDSNARGTVANESNTGGTVAVDSVDAMDESSSFSSSSSSDSSSPSSPRETIKKPTGTSSTNDFMSSLTVDPSSKAASGTYRMTPVHVVLARVQSDVPVWNDKLKRFVSSYYDDPTDAYVGLVDTINAASVEGALMYVQAECINYATRSTENRCVRKNEMAYIVFYEFAITQTNETLALYQDVASQNEYGDMLAMDSGRCTPDSITSSGGEVFPTACYYFNGDEGEPNVGPFVGGTTKETDPRAPYPHNVWYSFPNTCPLKEWSEKTPECRKNTRKGLCDIGVMPDGNSCTFAYRVLGFLPIDDLVGITSMKSNTTGETYANFTQFCEDGGVEFEATESGEWIQSIPFWENPQDEEANVERATKLVEAYYNLTNGLIETLSLDSSIIKHMLPLPTPEELAAENPACYLNVKKCNTEAGCKRELFGSTCTVCNSTSEGCKAPPSDWSFPTLQKAVGENGGTGDATSADNSTAPGKGRSASASATNGVSAVLMSSLLAVATALFF